MRADLTAAAVVAVDRDREAVDPGDPAQIAVAGVAPPHLAGDRIAPLDGTPVGGDDGSGDDDWLVGRRVGGGPELLERAGTSRASLGLGAGPAAGWLIVARASLVHQINAAATATTAAIAAAANTSALVRRSGLTIRRW